MSLSKQLIDIIQSQIKGTKTNEPMSKYTSFHIGGPAEVMVFPKSEEELLWLHRLIIDNELNYFILGKGTNLLVRDNGIKGIVINMRYLNKFHREEVDLIIQAGTALSKLLNYCSLNGLTGLEFATGIPGSLGGALTMNAGTSEGTIGEIVKEIRIADKGQVRVLFKDQIKFDYRYSSLSEDMPILSARLHLSLENNKPELKKRIKEIWDKRKKSQPWTQKSAGSFFKNPSGQSAAKLIDSLGLKGRCVGGALISQKHANFIVNKGQATASDVLALANHIQEKVYESFKIMLIPEVRVVGET